MRDITDDLKVIVDTNKYLNDNETKCKYNVRTIYDNIELSISLSAWFEGNNNQQGVIKKYELVDGTDYAKICNPKSLRNSFDYYVTVEVFALLALKYNLVPNLSAIEVLRDHLVYYQSNDNAKQLMALTGRNDVINVLKKFNLI